MSSPKARLYHPSVIIPLVVSPDGDFITWKAHPDNAPWRRPTDRTLLAFARLRLANASEVGAFASKNGVLNALEVKPEFQRETDLSFSDGSVWRMGVQNTLCGREPIYLWQALAAQLHAMLRINSALKGRSRSPLPSIGADADWKTLGVLNGPLEDVREAQFFLMGWVNDWLRIGGVGLNLGITEWSPSRTDWKIQIAYGGLLGALAYRLLLIVVGESNLYACDGCGGPYVRTQRAPRPGQENFCPDCPEVAARRASKRWKSKKKVNLK
jgi:hypothetical protein